MRFVLLHSPLLGPLSWQAVAADLRGRGHAVEAPAWPRLGGLGDDPYGELARGLAAGLPDGEPPVLVAHSGAGALVPALAAVLPAPPAAVVFCDAILPHPSRSWFDTAPPDLAAQLRIGAEDELLPTWDRWWPPGALEQLVPDAAVREALLAELEPLPLGWFEAAAPNLGLEAPGAYLQLSGAYDDEARVCGRLGWPVVSLPLHHLAVVTHPAAVAGALESLSRARQS